MPSIKQVLPAEKTIGVRAFVRTPFHTPCPARYSVLHLLGVLSGGNEPPLCKGRWLAKQDGGIVKIKIIPKTIPQSPSVTAPFTQGSLFYVHLCRVNFLDKHCFCGHKSEALREAGRFLFYITFILLTKLLID